MLPYVVITAEGSDVFGIKQHAVDIDLTLGLIEQAMASMGKVAIVELVETHILL